MPHDSFVLVDVHSEQDYPAAHSMDTIWFAVDENGELGKFEPSSTGVVPVLEGMEPLGWPAGISKTPDNDSRFYEALEGYFQAQYGVDIYYDEPPLRSDDDEGYPDYLAPRFFHLQKQVDDHNGFYYWRDSPEQPLTLADLPEYLRSSRYLLHLKDYDFRSREPVDIFDYATGGYGWSISRIRLYPGSPLGQTLFPVNGPWDNQLFLKCVSEEVFMSGVDGKIFFARDDEGYLAVFHTDRFGGIPLAKQSVEDAVRHGSFWSLDDADTWRALFASLPAAFPGELRPDLYGPPLALSEVFDLKKREWLVKAPLVVLLSPDDQVPMRTEKCSSDVFGKIPVSDILETAQGVLTIHPGVGPEAMAAGARFDERVIRSAIEEGFLKQAWRAEWARHWLEYAFGLAAPRLFGFYQYDATWHHAIPYVRVGTPAQPVRLDQFDASWRERMNPVHFAGVRFAEAELVQPFEHVPCRSHSYATHDEFFRQAGQLWIDSRLEHVHHLSESENEKFKGSEDLLLRRARRHIQRIRDLALK